MSPGQQARRQYIRHPADVPLALAAQGSDAQGEAVMSNVSYGGLACASERQLSVGTWVKVRIPLVQPEFEAEGRVVWCQQRAPRYEVGIEFADADEAFRMRMIEQICHIEQYKNEVREHEGRALSGEQAAQEWIERYAHQFPSVGPHET